MKPFLPFVLAAALAAGAAPSLAGDDPAQPAPPPESQALRWYDGFEAGLAAAKEKGASLMLVYLRAEIPPCLLFEKAVLSKPETAKIGEKHVAVMLTGGRTLSPEVRAFMLRYGVRRYPTLFVMNTSAHVVVPDVPGSVPGMMAALEEAAKRDAALAEARTKTGPEAEAALRDLLVERMAWDEALPLVEAAVASRKDQKSYEQLDRVLAGLGRVDDERANLLKMAEIFPQSEDRPTWRVRAASIEVERVLTQEELNAASPPAQARLKALLDKVIEEKDPPGVARTTLGMARMARNTGNLADASRLCDAAVEACPSCKFASEARLFKATVLLAKGDVTGARAVLEQILREHPGTDAAKSAASLIAQLDKQAAGGK